MGFFNKCASYTVLHAKHLTRVLYTNMLSHIPKGLLAGKADRCICMA